MEILVQGVLGWLTWRADTEFQLHVDLYDDDYRRLILNQNAIGWKHVFLGRFTWDWADQQDDYYATHPGINPKKRRSGERWQVAIIGRTLWEQWYELWCCVRNTYVHGADATQRDLLRTLRALYAKRKSYEPSAQELLMKDIWDHETLSTRQIKNWLAIHAPVFRTSYRRAKKVAIAGMKSIRHYFGGVI